MELSYKQLEATLLGHFRIHPDRKETFQSRVKQLQRLKFPTGVNIGRGGKMAYGAWQLLQLVTAFELIGTRVPAQSATELVKMHWRSFEVGYSLAHRQAATSDAERRERIFAWIVSRAFGDLQIERPAEKDFPARTANASRLFVADHPSFVAAFTRPDSSRRSFLYPVFCLSDLISSVAAAAEAAGVADFWQDAEIHDWLPRRDEAEGMLQSWLLIQCDPWADRSLRDMARDFTSDRLFGLSPPSPEELQHLHETERSARLIIRKMSEPLQRAMARDGEEHTTDSLREALFLGLYEPGEEELRLTSLGEAVGLELLKREVALQRTKEAIADIEGARRVNRRIDDGDGR